MIISARTFTIVSRCVGTIDVGIRTGLRRGSTTEADNLDSPHTPVFRNISGSTAVDDDLVCARRHGRHPRIKREIEREGLEINQPTRRNCEAVLKGQCQKITRFLEPPENVASF
jgi:hypothetical protein